jgi:PAS domain S-box-containing protein
MNSKEIRVLHVDDEQALAELGAEMLHREDDRFSVATAGSASEGADRLAADDFDCIVSDYDMPGQNGIEFLETVRDEYPDVPFMLYTGKGSEEVASKALSTGATDYLQKGSGTDQYKLLANRIRNAVEQSRTRQRAVDLERIRALVSEINQALVRADSRSVAETRVCEILSESDPYLFAWIGEVAADTDHVEPRASAGLHEDYLDDITVTADDTATGRGPGGTALRERRVAVSQDIAEDPEFPWPEAAYDRGYRAVAAFPLEYNDTLYGALGVYADRPHAFDEDEQEALAELGADIGATIHSLEMQQDLRRFKNAVDHAGHAIFMTATDGTIEYVNPAFETVTGYSGDEAVGRNPRILKSGEMSDAYYEELWETLLDGTVWEEEVINRRQDGDLYYANQTIAPIHDENDDIDSFVAVQNDITEQKTPGGDAQTANEGD